MSLRKAAEAVVYAWDADMVSGGVSTVIDNLRAALAAPDEFVEAAEIIESLLVYALQVHIDPAPKQRAREFLKRQER